MVNVKLTFMDCDFYEEGDCIKVFCDKKNDNKIAFISEEEGLTTRVNLDIPTAIKFYKTLRMEINKAKGGQNG
jgi:hypothetical protein